MGFKTSQNWFVGYYFFMQFMGVILSLYGMSTAIAFRYDEFNVTSGQITEVKISDYADDENSGWCVYVSYNYTVDNTIYSATNEIICSSYSSTVKERSERYSEGDTITVFYNPQYPKESVITKSSHPSELITLVILAVLPATMVLIAWIWYNRAFIQERKIMEKFENLSINPELYYNSTLNRIETESNKDNKRIEFEQLMKVDKLYFDENKLSSNYYWFYLYTFTGVLLSGEFGRLLSFIAGRRFEEPYLLLGITFFRPWIYVVEITLVMVLFNKTSGFFRNRRKDEAITENKILSVLSHILGLVLAGSALMFVIMYTYLTFVLSYLGFLIINTGFQEIGIIIPIYLIWLVICMISYPISYLWYPSIIRIYQRSFQYFSLVDNIKNDNVIENENVDLGDKQK